MKYYNYSDFNLEKIIEHKRKSGLTVGVALPVLNEAATLPKTLSMLKRLHHIIDQVIVVDGGSTDGSVAICESFGVPCIADRIMRKISKQPYRNGKGWNLWTSIYYLETDIIVWIDADILNVHPRFITGIVGPMLKDKDTQFVKGYYRRPKGDARVTEIAARPLLNILHPRAKEFIQPLSGEYGGRREFLEGIFFYSGYSVEVAVLLQALERLKSKEIAQSYLGVRKHTLQDIPSLGRMSASILFTLLSIAENQHILRINVPLRGTLRQYQSRGGKQYQKKDSAIIDAVLPPLKSLVAYGAIWRKRKNRSKRFP